METNIRKLERKAGASSFGGAFLLKKRSGQSEMIEHMLLVLFIVVVLIVLIFFLSGWQVSQLELAKTQGVSEAALAASKTLGYYPGLVSDPYVFDDASLTALQGLDSFCSYMEQRVGREWFAEVSVLGQGEKKECNSLNYPDCNYWGFCIREGRKVSYSLPANVYRRQAQVFSASIAPRTDLAVLTAGVYNDR